MALTKKETIGTNQFEIEFSAEGEGCIGHLLVVPFVKVWLIVFHAVMDFAKLQHLVVAIMRLCPNSEVTRDEIVPIVLAQLLDRTSCHI